MSRFARHILFASVIALHAVVSLCGQCLHEFAGSSHQLGLASKTHGPDDAARSPRDSADNCLICHFVAQGQLPVECGSQISAIAVAELPAPSLQAGRSVHTHVPSSPRAPPESIQA
jgi:hypothetical protein